MKILIQIFFFSVGYVGALYAFPSEISVLQGQASIYGIASWYSEADPGINRHTANGEVFDDSQMTCAAWDLPFGTLLKVTNRSNGKSITCRVNDRGPARRLNRAVDLTKTAFSRIASLKLGLVNVSVMIVS